MTIPTDDRCPMKHQETLPDETPKKPEPNNQRKSEPKSRVQSRYFSHSFPRSPNSPVILTPLHLTTPHHTPHSIFQLHTPHSIFQLHTSNFTPRTSHLDSQRRGSIPIEVEPRSPQLARRLGRAVSVVSRRVGDAGSVNAIGGRHGQCRCRQDIRIDQRQAVGGVLRGCVRGCLRGLEGREPELLQGRRQRLVEEATEFVDAATVADIAQPAELAQVALEHILVIEMPAIEVAAIEIGAIMINIIREIQLLPLGAIPAVRRRRRRHHTGRHVRALATHLRRGHGVRGAQAGVEAVCAVGGRGRGVRDRPGGRGGRDGRDGRGGMGWGVGVDLGRPEHGREYGRVLLEMRSVAAAHGWREGVGVVAPVAVGVGSGRLLVLLPLLGGDAVRVELDAGEGPGEEGIDRVVVVDGGFGGDSYGTAGTTGLLLLLLALVLLVAHNCLGRDLEPLAGSKLVAVGRFPRRLHALSKGPVGPARGGDVRALPVLLMGPNSLCRVRVLGEVSEEVGEEGPGTFLTGCSARSLAGDGDKGRFITLEMVVEKARRWDSGQYSLSSGSNRDSREKLGVCPVR
jgi:hypothetical protein